MRRLVTAGLLSLLAACGRGEDDPLVRQARTERDQWGLVTCAEATDALSCVSYRAIVGVSMGAGGAAQIGLSRPDLFDTVAMLGSPGIDFTFMLRTMQRGYLGGFCPREQILANIDAINDPSGAGFCGPVVGSEPFEPSGKIVEPSQDFNHWHTGMAAGRGADFGRNLFRRAVRDLVTAYGNPFSHNADSPVLPPGVPRAYLDRSDEDRCAQPLVLEGVRHLEYNPTGEYPVIVACDTSTSTEGTFDPEHPADISMEFLLSVDYNRNGRRDYAEPVVLFPHERFEDTGATPDDAYDWRAHPRGTAGNWLYDPGEPFSDDGLDGVPGTGDFGEGNGRFDYNPGYERWLDNGPRRILERAEDGQLARINVYADAGIRDFLLSAGSTNWFWASFQDRVGKDLAKDYTTLASLVSAEATSFDFLDVDYSPAGLGRHAYLRYGDPNADARKLAAGDGNHVGAADQILNRLLVAFGFIQSRFIEPDLDEVIDVDIAKLLRKETYRSEALDETREFGIALPPGYDEPANTDRRYPVVYFFHGLNQDYEQLLQSALLFSSYMSESYRPERARRRQADWAKMIIVVPSSLCSNGECLEGSFNANQQGVDGEGGRFQDAFFELMAHVEQTYRVRMPEEIPRADPAFAEP